MAREQLCLNTDSKLPVYCPAFKKLQGKYLLLIKINDNEASSTNSLQACTDASSLLFSTACRFERHVLYHNYTCHAQCVRLIINGARNSSLLYSASLPRQIFVIFCTFTVRSGMYNLGTLNAPAVSFSKSPKSCPRFCDVQYCQICFKFGFISSSSISIPITMRHQ